MSLTSGSALLQIQYLQTVLSGTTFANPSSSDSVTVQYAYGPTSLQDRCFVTSGSLSGSSTYSLNLGSLTDIFGATGVNLYYADAIFLQCVTGQLTISKSASNGFSWFLNSTGTATLKAGDSLFFSGQRFTLGSTKNMDIVAGGSGATYKLIIFGGSSAATTTTTTTTTPAP